MALESDPIDTHNEWAITAHHGRVVIQFPVPRTLEREEALRLAAWLLVCVEMSEIAEGNEGVDVLAAFVRTVDAIRDC